MGFLADFAARLIEWFVSKFIISEAERLEKQAVANVEAKIDEAKLADAKTKEEQANALKSVVDHINPK